MWSAQPVPDRGFSPSVLIGLVLLLFLLTADVTSWGSGNSASAQQVRLAQHAQVQAHEVREKLLYELTVSNERLEKENRQLHLQLLVLRRMFRACRGNRTQSSHTSTSELMQLAQEELALASGDQTPGRNKQQVDARRHETIHA